jgi:hypothetical protein
MRRYLLRFAILTLVPLFGGCGEKLPPKEFGNIVEGVPRVQGADRPFEMPELGPAPPEDPRTRGRHP